MNREPGWVNFHSSSGIFLISSFAHDKTLLNCHPACVPAAPGAIRASVVAPVGVVVAPGRGAAVGGVAKLVDVETVKARLQVAHLQC